MEKTQEAFLFSEKIEKVKTEKNQVSFVVPLPSKYAKKIKGKKEVLGITEGVVFEGKVVSGGASKLSLHIISPSKVLGELKDGEKISIEVFEGDREVFVPSDLLSALQKNKKAEETWQNTTEKARADWVLWFVTVKNIETRKKHIEKAISMLQAGKKRVCCFGGRNWVLKTQK